MSDTLASVLKSEPDWTQLPSDIPPAMRTLVRCCLTKDRRRRVSDISAARFVLTELANIEASMAAGGTARSGHDQAHSRRRSVLPIAATALLTTIVVGVAVYVWRPVPQPSGVVRFAYTPVGQSLSGTPAQVVAISADGTKLAYTADQRLYLRSLSELEPRAVTESAMLMLNPVFAPDGESLLYVTLSEGGPTLRRIPFRGGAASTIATFPDAPGFSGISWGRDGILIAVLGEKGGILRVNERGGAPERLVMTGRDEIIHGPQMLPGGRTILFTVARVVGDDRWDKAQIVAQSFVDGNRRVLVDGGSDGRYVSSGHLLYSVGGTIYGAPFDPDSLVVGRAAPVIPGVRRASGGQTGGTHFAVSETGTLAYVPGPATGFSNARSLVVGNGREQPVALKAPAAVYAHPRVSSDGRLLAVARIDDASSDIWTYDLSGTMAMQRLTLGGGNRFPVWSADGRRVTFQSIRDGDAAIWWQHIAGGTAERLTRPAKDEAHVPEAWSRDGTRLLFSVRKGAVYSLWVFTLAGRKVEAFGKVESAESLSATFAPDGRWVAYASTPRSGGTISPNRGVFVEPFPPTGLKRQLPKTLLDYHPVWAPDGKSILYIAGSARPPVSVPVTTQPTLTFGTPVDLPRAPAPGLVSVDVRGYDLLPDGRLVSVAGVDATTAVSGVDIRIVLNWFEELRRLVPTQ
jgi:serine/threonine-protein kinase